MFCFCFSWVSSNTYTVGVWAQSGALKGGTNEDRLNSERFSKPSGSRTIYVASHK